LFANACEQCAGAGLVAGAFIAAGLLTAQPKHTAATIRRKSDSAFRFDIEILA
jgi:hypothetical protein